MQKPRLASPCPHFFPATAEELNIHSSQKPAAKLSLLLTRKHPHGDELLPSRKRQTSYTGSDSSGAI